MNLRISWISQYTGLLEEALEMGKNSNFKKKETYFQELFLWKRLDLLKM